MAARLNSEEIRRQALRMTDAGLSCKVVGRQLGIAHTTVRWYVLNRDDFQPGPLYAVDALGERVSLPPGCVYTRCETCGGREAADRPHQHGREAA